MRGEPKSFTCNCQLWCFKVPKTEVAERKFIRSPTEKADMVTSFGIVINLPESLGSKEAKKIMRELKTEIKKEPPRVILDLSRVKTMDCAGVHGLLTCMQEIARYDCAIQLRAVSPKRPRFWNLPEWTTYSNNSHRCRRKLRVLPLLQHPFLRK